MRKLFAPSALLALVTPFMMASANAATVTIS